MKIDMDRQVAEWVANDEGLYVRLLEVMVDAYEDVTSDEENISYIADQLELMVLDFYLSGEETEAGSWLIRAALATVNWYALATDEYSDFLADRGV
jgi:hypothetical protein